MPENKKEKVEQCANSQKRKKTKRAQRLRHGGTTQKGKPIFSSLNAYRRRRARRPGAGCRRSVKKRRGKPPPGIRFEKR